MAKRKRVLLTGAGGFIGAHCVEYFLEKTNWEIVCLDSFRHKGQVSRMEAARLRHFDHMKSQAILSPDADFQERVTVYRHDLSAPIDQQLENQIMCRQINDQGRVVEKKLDYIVNMASDSAVERSTTDPTLCLRNNYDVAINMLEFARKVKPEKFIQISTDEVYGEAEADSAGHPEWDVILPSNPYAASKAAQEAVAIAYWRTYGVPVVLTNCMNIVGEWQDPEKFLPKIIGFVEQGKQMPIYADPNEDGTWNIGSRVYLDVKNKADAIIFILGLPVAMYEVCQGTKRPDRYNICGIDELNNLELAQMVAEVMGKELNYELIPSESARPGYDRRYALDGSKLANLGWEPPFELRQTLERIVGWTGEHPEWMIS